MFCNTILYLVVVSELVPIDKIENDTSIKICSTADSSQLTCYIVYTLTHDSWL